MTGVGLRTYHRATRSATYGFLSALPLLVAYESMIVAVNLDRTRSVRVGADVILKDLLAFTGLSGGLLLAVLVAIGGLVAFVVDRNRHIPLRSRYFVGVLGESAVYAICVAVGVSWLVAVLFAIAPDAPGDLWTQLALSIGAGLYEELLFRVLLVGGLALALGALNVDSAYAIAALIGAALFSGAHYIGPMGDPFAVSTFVFRFAFGLALNGLFLWRGFAVAAWTHALYDVMIVTGVFG